VRRRRRRAALARDARPAALFQFGSHVRPLTT
jgi:hypothetical protein